jgi:serralysin
MIDARGGADTVQGGRGVDRLAGGAGADRFVWTDLQSGDVIRDFSQAAGDRIDLRGIDANIDRAGNQAFDFIGTAAFSGQQGELRAVITGSATRIAGDVDGDGRADMVNADFLL